MQGHAADYLSDDHLSWVSARRLGFLLRDAPAGRYEAPAERIGGMGV
jgi:hypothetical protein